MNANRRLDWDPASGAVRKDPRAAYDEMRERCPVAYGESMGWSLFRHEDIHRVIRDHETFSNAVSQHLSVPNGMDPPEHTAYRRIVERYFTSERMQAFEPACRTIASALVREVREEEVVDLVARFALSFAVRAQCAFSGWPPSLHEPLIRWTKKNHEATLAQDRQAMAEIAREFQGFIDDLVESRRKSGAAPEDDVTASLMHEEVNGRRLNREEIASTLRNWTVGEVGTISASVGILVHYLAQEAGLQERLRAEPSLLPAAIDEILRLHGPLVANRRVTTRPVTVGGRRIEAGERATVMWMAGHRDGRVFEEPVAFRLDRDPGSNLLYGAGIHVCPGAPLARLELRVVLEELLEGTTGIESVAGRRPDNAVYPAGGFASLPVRMKPAADR